MPNYIPCANTRCQNPVHKMGDYCDVCQAKNDRAEREWNDREKERRQAEYEHKQKGKK